MEPSPRIAITGLGAVCGAGLTVEAIWNAVQSGKSAVAPITHWDASRWPIRQAAEVTGVSDTTLVEDRKYHKFLSRTDLFGLYAADIALQQSGLTAHRDRMDSPPPRSSTTGAGSLSDQAAALTRTTTISFPP